MTESDLLWCQKSTLCKKHPKTQQNTTKWKPACKNTFLSVLKKIPKNSKKIPTQLKKTDTLKKEGANFEKSEKKFSRVLTVH